MSSIGSSNIDPTTEIVALAASRASDLNEQLSIMTEALTSVLHALPEEVNRVAVAQVKVYVTATCKTSFTNSEDDRIHKIMESVSIFLEQEESQTVAIALARVLKIILDSRGVDELDRDLKGEILDTLYPDEDEEWLH